MQAFQQAAKLFEFAVPLRLLPGASAFHFRQRLVQLGDLPPRRLQLLLEHRSFLLQQRASLAQLFGAIGKLLQEPLEIVAAGGKLAEGVGKRFAGCARFGPGECGVDGRTSRCVLSEPRRICLRAEWLVKESIGHKAGRSK